MNFWVFGLTSCCGLYYILHCCLFTSDIIKEKYMNNNCKEFFKKKYRKYKYPHFEFIDNDD